ncbi:MAG: putative bifunctional diguanylate cyclase/phosphodiesterase [bacterium]
MGLNIGVKKKNNDLYKIKVFAKDNYYQYIKASISALLFLVLCYPIRHGMEMAVNGFVIEAVIIRALMAHTQLIISVFLVVETVKNGYLIAYTLNIFAILLVLIDIFAKNDLKVLPGVTSYTVALILIIILNHYRKGLYHQFEMLIEQRSELKYMAYYDSLTDIPNRKKIIEQLNVLIERSLKKQSSFSIVFIDLDNFKRVNDSIGHYAGDFVLQKIVERINSYIHQDDILGRLGSDEFALIIQRDLKKTEIYTYIKGLQDLFLESYNVKNKEVYINASFGVSIYPYAGNNSSDLLKSADIAMYKAKEDPNKSIRFFSRTLEEGFLYNLKIEEGLYTAIEKEEFYLMFQPQYRSQDKSLRGFEALLRWESIELGNISPAHFIPTAEKTGFISEIGEWVLRNSLMTFNNLCREYDNKPILSINISVAQLLESNFTDMVWSILEQTGFDSKYLEFEITESMFISYPEYVMKILTQLKQMGISIALDDFGTGYASLGFLQNIAIDILKIDKIFIDNINKYNKNRIIIGPIIDLAHKLDFEVVAEGVESEEQLKFLQNMNCDYIQGYLLGKPVNGTALTNILKYNKSLA